MSPSKSATIKKGRVTKEEDHEGGPLKIKNDAIAYDVDVTRDVVDDKTTDDPLVTEESEDTESDDTGLYDEDINPFGDKWEE